MTSPNPVSTVLTEGLVNLNNSRPTLRGLDEGPNWYNVAEQSEGYAVTINDLNQVTPILRNMAINHPLHKRGAQLRHAYIFGRGIEISGLTKEAEKVKQDTINQSVLFSVDAQERLNLESFTTGNIFVFKNVKTNRFTLVPMEQIREITYDTFDTSYIQFVRRVWKGPNGEDVSRWYKTADFSKTNKDRRPRAANGGKFHGKEIPIDNDYVVYIKTSPAFAGSPLGVPDSLAGALWSVSYSNYLSDSAALTNILKRVAWKITNASSKEQAAKDSVQVGTPQKGGIGASVGLSGEQQLNSVGVPSAQVDFNNGQPLAAMVASSFGVPVIALLSSPGATGGSYGAATTLDEPTRNGFKAAQDSWVTFYTEILRDLNGPRTQSRVGVIFPSIDKDPAYRQMQSGAQAYATGAIFQDEFRSLSIDVLGIQDQHPGELPETPDFGGKDPIPRQGNSGAVAGGTDQGETNHDNDDNS